MPADASRVQATSVLSRRSIRKNPPYCAVTNARRAHQNTSTFLWNNSLSNATHFQHGIELSALHARGEAAAHRQWSGVPVGGTASAFSQGDVKLWTFYHFGLVPALVVHGWLWQIVSYAFLHDGLCTSCSTCSRSGCSARSSNRTGAITSSCSFISSAPSEPR